jgi:hypothetical protein
LKQIKENEISDKAQEEYSELDSKLTIAKKIHMMIEKQTCLSLNELLNYDDDILESLIFIKLEHEN